MLACGLVVHGVLRVLRRPGTAVIGEAAAQGPVMPGSSPWKSGLTGRLAPNTGPRRRARKTDQRERGGGRPPTGGGRHAHPRTGARPRRVQGSQPPERRARNRGVYANDCHVVL